MKQKRYAFPEYLLAEDIKRFRKVQRLTQLDLASLVGVSNKTIERWESGGGKITGPAVPLLTILMEQQDLTDRYEIPRERAPIRLWYMFRRQACTVIDVEERTRRVWIRNYTKHPQMRAFGVNDEPTYEEYEQFLESRCFPRSRDKMKLMLKELNLPFYDPFLIIEKTEGRMAEDEFWIRIERMGGARDDRTV